MLISARTAAATWGIDTEKAEAAFRVLCDPSLAEPRDVVTLFLLRDDSR